MNPKAMRCCFTLGVVLVVLCGLRAGGSAKAEEKGQPLEFETGFYYTVQPGDTLWDLSQKFSDTPWQWPEMWQENKTIANPHRIYPGDVIRLYRRKGMYSYAPGDLEKMLFYYAGIVRVGFIREQPLAPHGTIYKVRVPRRLIADGDIVYIAPAESRQLTPGQRYTTYRTIGPLRDAADDTSVGYQHLLTGVVEIIEQQTEYAVAKVVKAYRSIHLTDGIMPYFRRLPRLELQESTPGIEGQFIISEEHKTIFGEYDVAFINKGKRDGLRPGQLYSIFYRDRHTLVGSQTGAKKELVTPVDFGQLLVLHTEDTASTVLITDSDKEFEPKTPIRTPLTR